MLHSLENYIELYKRKVFDKIPVFEDETGIYYLSPKQLQAISLLTDNSTKMLGVGGSARCFVGETLVNCVDGYKEIKEVKKGDIVLSYNEILSIIEYKKVVKKYCFSLSSPAKFITFEDINLKSLEDHEYLFRGKWTKASELRKRSLEKNRGNILSIQHGTYSIVKQIWKRKTWTNESCSRFTWIFKNDANCKWKEQNNKDAQRNSQNVFAESEQLSSNKSQEFYKGRQSSRKPRMDYMEAKCSIFSGRRKIAQFYKRRKAARKLFKAWIHEWYGEIRRAESKRYKKEVRSSCLYSQDASRRIWRFSGNNKGCNIETVEAREITECEIINSKITKEICLVYDLEVEDNHSYTVTKENIIVHNCGKSLLLCFWQLMNRLAYPKTRGLIGRLELTNLDSTTGKTLYGLMDFWGLEYKKDYTYDAQNHHKLIFNNESEVFLMDTFFPLSDDLFTKFGSLELTDAAVDESNETRLGVINKIYSRTGWCNNEKYGLPRKLLETFNPQKNHVYDRYWKPYRDNCEPVEKKFIKSLPHDNPHPAINKWVEDIIKMGDRRMIERLVKGNFDYDDDDNALVSYDKICDMFTNSFISDDGKMFLSMDIAITNDRFVCFAWKGLRVKEIRCIRNVSKPISTQDEKGEWINKVDFSPLLNTIEELTKKWAIPRSNIIYDGDGIGSKLNKYLTGAVAIHNGGQPIRKEYKNISNELGYKLVELINSDSIYIECNLTSEIDDLLKTELQASLKRSSEVGEKLSLISKAEVKQLIGHSPDLFDAMKYRLLFILTRHM